jgi:hypothetical protein
LFSKELGWRMVYIVDAFGVLGRQSRRCRHCVTAMSSNNFLVSLEPTASISICLYICANIWRTLPRNCQSPQSPEFVWVS